MAFPVVANSALDFNGSVTSHVADLPSGITAGDLLIVLVGLGSTATIGGTITTEYNTRSNVSFSSARAMSFWKVATGSEGSTIAFTTSSNAKSVTIALRITGWDAATDPEISVFASATSTAPNPNSLSPSWGAEDTLWIPWFVCNDNNTCTAFPETDNNLQRNVSDTGGALVALCTLNSNTASYNAGAFTIASAAWAAYTIAVRPVNAMTGTIAVTQAGDTSAISGTVLNPITGTISVTQAGDTGAIAGAESFIGTLAATQVDQFAGHTGKPSDGFDGLVANPITGTMAANQADQAGAFVGSLNISGTVAATQADQTAAISGTIANPITGTIGATQAGDTGAFTGDSVSDGTLNAIQADQTGAFSGTVVNPVTGVLGATQDDQAGSFTGTSVVAVTGVLGAMQDDQTGAFNGTQTIPAVTGTLAATQESDTGSFTGTAFTAVTGTISVTQDSDSGAFNGTITIPTLPPPGTITCVLSAPTATCVLSAASAACTISPVNVIAGSNVEITTTFRQSDGTLADPTTVTALIRHPDGTTSSPTPTSASVGVWTTVIPTDESGFWFYQISGAGNDLDVVCVGSFCAEPSLVLV